MTDGTTCAFWVGEGDDIVEEFDTQLGQRPDYSRSEEIKNAMRMYLVIQGAINDADFEFGREVPKRHWVRQALRDKIAAEERRD